MKLNIEQNRYGFRCLFEHKGQEYIGSITWQEAYPDWKGVECIIFKAVDRQITFENALGLCWARDCEYSERALREHIEDFIAYN